MTKWDEVGTGSLAPVPRAAELPLKTGEVAFFLKMIPG